MTAKRAEGKYVAIEPKEGSVHFAGPGGKGMSHDVLIQVAIFIREALAAAFGFGALARFVEWYDRD